MATIAERFTDKVSHEPNTGCWLWTGTHDRCGYGCIKVGQRVVGAHRVSWTLNKGAIPDGLDVLHRCDVPSCVNPDHLFVGTAKENAADMMAKGRHRFRPANRGEAHWSRTHPERIARGANNGATKLSDTDVLAIRAAYTGAHGELSRLAATYNISPRSVGNIVNRETWGHI